MLGLHRHAFLLGQKPQSQLHSLKGVTQIYIHLQGAGGDGHLNSISFDQERYTGRLQLIEENIPFLHSSGCRLLANGDISSYEEQRLSNIRENQRMLFELGLGDSSRGTTADVRPTTPRPRPRGIEPSHSMVLRNVPCEDVVDVDSTFHNVIQELLDAEDEVPNEFVTEMFSAVAQVSSRVFRLIAVVALCLLHVRWCKVCCLLHVQAWRKRVRQLTRLVDVAHHVRHLRKAMRDTYDGLSLFKPGWDKKGEFFLEWIAQVDEAAVGNCDTPSASAAQLLSSEDENHDVDCELILKLIKDLRNSRIPTPDQFLEPLPSSLRPIPGVGAHLPNPHLHPHPHLHPNLHPNPHPHPNPISNPNPNPNLKN